MSCQAVVELWFQMKRIVDPEPSLRTANKAKWIDLLMSPRDLWWEQKGLRNETNRSETCNNTLKLDIFIYAGVELDTCTKKWELSLFRDMMHLVYIFVKRDWHSSQGSFKALQELDVGDCRWLTSTTTSP